WLFCFPVAWGFSSRFLPTFLGLGAPRRGPAITGLALLWLAPVVELGGSPAAARLLTLAAVLLACFSLRVFEPAARPAKTLGVDPRYPRFVRLAFGWLAISALLYVAAVTPGLEGAGRHAFTVGFLALLIFSIGPRILPSFLNSRELWSPRLMFWTLAILTTGCFLRVLSEPLAYSNMAPVFWRVLPVSGVLELSAVLLFACNIGRTLATPMPAWFAREQIKDSMTLYWYVTSYPATRKLLIEAGLKTLATAGDIPKSLSLREAAEADGADSRVLLEKLAEFFEARLARALRRPS
ncbi:MAG TPA: hypothetical protein VEU62_20865, partial [Bryobacterales bacterium]|nr:hypothetical protein [Bryobacterales bacterium]